MYSHARAYLYHFFLKFDKKKRNESLQIHCARNIQRVAYTNIRSPREKDTFM